MPIMSNMMTTRFSQQWRFSQNGLSGGPVLHDSSTPTIPPMNAEHDVTILVVDDDPIMQEILAGYLSAKPYTVYRAASGEEALLTLNNGQQFDLILLDVSMPQMSGFEVCEHIRAHYPPHALPVIMVTAKDQTEDLTKGFASGANDYLVKPFSEGELLARVQIHLNLLDITRAYEKFVPYEFLRFLQRKSIVDVKLGDHVEKEMTVLFSDIRNFTALSEMMTPAETFGFLNSYLSQMEPFITEHHGFIDKYVGDTIMALFPTSSDDAVDASVSMVKRLKLYNEGRKRAGYKPIQIGVGLNTGELMLGTVGGRNRMDSTVISDAVNLASRLEGLTKLFGVSILMSEYTLFGIEHPERFQVRFLGRVQVKGKQEIVSIFEVFNGDAKPLFDLKLQTKSAFNEAIMLYFAKKFSEAAEAFENILHINPRDYTARFYLKRSIQYQAHGVHENWKGVETMVNK